MSGKLAILSGSANPALAESICRHLGLAPLPVACETYSDTEIHVRLKGNVRGADVYVVQPLCAPVNFNIMQLVFMLDALKRASADRVTAVVPYYSYGRMDVKEMPRAPIQAKTVANVMASVGMDRLLTIELHSGQIQGFFDLPVDNLFATPVLLPILRELTTTSNLVVVSPDASGVDRARAYAKRLDAELAIIDKRAGPHHDARGTRLESDTYVIGDVQGKTAVIIDDLIDTAGTVCSAARVLREAGAADVQACVTHPVLSGPAMERLQQAPLSRLLVTDTIPLSPEAQSWDKIQVASVAGLLAKAIHNIHTESSVSVLFV